MPLLQILWLVTIIMAGITLVFLLAILIRGVIDRKKNQKLAERRAELEGIVIETLHDTERVDQIALRPGDANIVGEIVRELTNVVRGSAKEELIEIYQRMDVANENIQKLCSPEERDRIQAVANLSILRGKKVEEALWSALADSSYHVRLDAATALADSPAKFEGAELFKRLNVDSIPRTRELTTLFLKMTKRNPDELVEVLNAPVAERVKMFAIRALGRSNNHTLVTHVMPFAESKSINLRAEALRALGNLQNPQAKAWVLKALNDPAWEVRSQAAVAAERIRMPSAVSLLKDLLNDQYWWVRFRAGLALVSLGESGIGALKDTAQQPTEGGRMAESILLEQGIA